MIIYQALQSADLFGQPFRFHTSPKTDKKDIVKKTGFGAIVSFVCIGISIAYFIFLLTEYIAGKVPPTVSVLTIQNNNAIEEQFDTDPVNIKLLLPISYQNADIDTYFNLWLVSRGKYTNTSTKLEDSSPSIRGNEQVEYGFKINEKKDIRLRSNPNKKSDNQEFEVVIQKCQSGGTVTCQLEADIDTLLQDDDCQVEIEVNFDELNVHTGKLVKKKHNIFSVIDPAITQIVEVQLFQGVVTTDNGFLWRVPVNQNYIKGFVKHTEYYGSGYYEGRKVDNPAQYTDSLKVVRVQLARQSIEYYVSYEKFPQVIAKFMAFFNTVIILGLIGKMGSQAKIFEMVMDSYVQTYYKATAAEIFEKKQQIEELERQQKQAKNKAQVNIDQGEKKQNASFDDIFPGKYDPLLNMNTLKSSVFHNTGHQKLQKHKQAIQKTGDDQQSLLEIKIDQSKEYLQKLTEKYYITQFERITAALDFRTLYMEVMEVKAGLQMLFTPEQYAAVQFVGRTISLDDNQNLQFAESKNHLEKIELVTQNKEYRDQKLTEFLKNSENATSELDKKIYECLVPQVNAVLKQKEIQAAEKNLITEDLNQMPQDQKSNGNENPQLGEEDQLKDQKLKQNQQDDEQILRDFPDSDKNKDDLLENQKDEQQTKK